MELQDSLRGRGLFTILFLVLVCKECVAQQAYNSQAGYICTDAASKSCNAFLLYRAQADFQNVSSIANLFHGNATRISELNSLRVAEELSIATPLFVPLQCRCFNGTSFANISYVVKSGDIYDDINGRLFESSTTDTALEVLNHIAPTDLQINATIGIPVRCACPSVSQSAAGIKMLVTYPVVSGNILSDISQSFGVSTSDVQLANELASANSQLAFSPTLLIPINTTLPSYTVLNISSPAPSPTASVPASLIFTTVNRPGYYVATGVGVCAGILILGAFGAFLFWKRRKETPASEDLAGVVPKNGVSVVSTLPEKAHVEPADKGLPSDPLAGMHDLVDSDRPVIFTYAEIKQATNDFADGNKLQGSVYRGVLRGEVVAIKQVTGNMSQELRILSRVHHTNLVRLVGICSTDTDRLYLVYEYAENGSLSDCLHTDVLARDKEGTHSFAFLSWTTRVQIALDAATGLEYIHDYVNPSYVHKDVKSSNILLDARFRAKIANFAIAKSDGGATMMTRHIAGTYGYMAPEYLAHGLVTTKADVFAFGVVMLELLSGDVAISEDDGGEGRYVFSAIRPILEAPDAVTKLKRWMDPVLENNFPTDAAMKFASLAKCCVETDPSSRPSMKDINFTLSNLVNSSMEWETSSVFIDTLSETTVEAR